MTSSTRTAEAFDAVLTQHAKATGPVRLPAADAAGFIAEFNSRYAALGMTVDPIPSSPMSDGTLRRANEKSPATSEDVTGDRLVR